MPSQSRSPHPRPTRSEPAPPKPIPLPCGLMPILLSLAAFVMTLLGGFVADRVGGRRHLVLGFAGGIMLGVVAFDLLPEALSADSYDVHGVPVPMLTLALAFLAIHIVERSVAMHATHESDYATHHHAHAPPHGNHHPYTPPPRRRPDRRHNPGHPQPPGRGRHRRRLPDRRLPGGGSGDRSNRSRLHRRLQHVHDHFPVREHPPPRPHPPHPGRPGPGGRRHPHRPSHHPRRHPRRLPRPFSPVSSSTWPRPISSQRPTRPAAPPAGR
ncbi:ZIP family metal transporter [Nonomuraea salmonea]|uniref:ZIP family metal transporter n=1 Tax=Nonomuraea salmonea TaxID=46181 RepID=UPI003CD0BD9E